MKPRSLRAFIFLLLFALLPLEAFSQTNSATSSQPTQSAQAATDISINDPARLLRSGPMPGYAEITETVIWLQTRRAVRAQLRYWKQGQPETARLTKEIVTEEARDHIARFVISGLDFGTRYDYEVYLEGQRLRRDYPLGFQTQAMWRWRTDPPAFRIALGSCAYINDPPFDRPGRPYGEPYDIFKAIAQAKPDAMIWLGDNVYTREADWLTESAMRYRYAKHREQPELQELLAATHHYAMWDDHDYGPNDADRTFRGREFSLRIFQDYWGNPGYGTQETAGTFGRFEWNDVEFFLLDNRYHRSPNNWPAGPDKVMFGEAQMRWLMEALVNSKATFKVIAGGNQMLNPLTFFEAFGNFPDEQKRLLNFLREAKISGVVFLSGDRHHTELIRLNLPGLYPLYDFTSSSLTAGGSRNPNEENNPARVPGTWVTGIRNFGILEVSGPAKARVMTLRTIEATGKELWKHDISAAELQFPAATR